jgi:hypothetical protein
MGRMEEALNTSRLGFGLIVPKCACSQTHIYKFMQIGFGAAMALDLCTIFDRMMCVPQKGEFFSLSVNF